MNTKAGPLIRHIKVCGGSILTRILSGDIAKDTPRGTNLFPLQARESVASYYTGRRASQYGSFIINIHRRILYRATMIIGESIIYPQRYTLNGKLKWHK
jgi:hypothetical protein